MDVFIVSQCLNFSDTLKLMDFNSHVITEGGGNEEYFPSSAIQPHLCNLNLLRNRK